MEMEPPAPGIAPKRRKNSGLAARILMAAMVGFIDALGWERPPTEVVQLAPDLNSGDIPLEFGDLPPL